MELRLFSTQVEVEVEDWVELGNKTWSSVSNSTSVLPFIPYPFFLITYPLSQPLLPYPLVLFLSRNLGEDSSSCCYPCCCYQAKVKSTPSPWPKTWSLTMMGPQCVLIFVPNYTFYSMEKRNDFTCCPFFKSGTDFYIWCRDWRCPQKLVNVVLHCTTSYDVDRLHLTGQL